MLDRDLMMAIVSVVLALVFLYFITAYGAIWLFVFIGTVMALGFIYAELYENKS